MRKNLQKDELSAGFGGGCEIRTHGGFDPITGFQDQLHKPLGQTSVFWAIFSFLRKVVRTAAH